MFNAMPSQTQATAAMRRHEEDAEKLLDLQLQLANEYAESSPALRRCWLESMAKSQVKLNNFAEAALCFAHMAALVRIIFTLSFHSSDAIFFLAGSGSAAAARGRRSRLLAGSL